MKADIFEGGHRIPYIITYPRLIEGGTKSNALVSLCDLMATMAELLGFELADNMAEDSVSNLPLWTGVADAVREDLIHQSGDGSLSLRRGAFKLEMCAGAGGYYTYPFKAEELVGLPGIQLYKLDEDIGEQNNVYAEYPEVVQELKERLRQYVKNGRSTPGKPQKNQGAEVWKTASWLAEEI